MESQIEFVDRTSDPEAPETEWSRLEAVAGARRDPHLEIRELEWLHGAAYRGAAMHGHGELIDLPIARRPSGSVSNAVLKYQILRLQSDLRFLLQHFEAKARPQLATAESLEKRQPPELRIDPRLQWCQENSDLLSAHPHSYAAIKHGRGIVAVAKTLREIRDQLGTKGIDRREVLVVRTDDFSA